MFSSRVRLFLKVGRLVCQQDFTKKTTETISMDLGWRLGLSPEQTSVTSGADLDEGMDKGFLSHFV